MSDKPDLRRLNPHFAGAIYNVDKLLTDDRDLLKLTLSAVPSKDATVARKLSNSEVAQTVSELAQAYKKDGWKFLLRQPGFSKGYIDKADVILRALLLDVNFNSSASFEDFRERVESAASAKTIEVYPK